VRQCNLDANRLGLILSESGFDVPAYLERNGDIDATGDAIGLIARHLVEGGVSERRPIIFRSVRGFVAFLHAIGSSPPHEQLALARCAAAGWQAWQTPMRNTAQDLWPEMTALADGFAARGIQPVFVAGDSHSEVYTGRAVADLDVAAFWLLCSGGSARGLPNARSISGYGAAIRKHRPAPGVPLILHFGQVDVEFVYYYQVATAERREISLIDLIDFIDSTVTSYFRFVDEMASPDLLLSAIFPPALSDEHVNEGSINAHIAVLNSNRDVTALQAALATVVFPGLEVRTALHYRLNLELKKGARARGLRFIDPFKDLLDGGRVKPALDRAGGRDHHLDVEAVAAILARHLKAALEPPPAAQA